jgi:hypothetical protein
LNVWEWRDPSFPFPYPQQFDGRYFERFGSDQEPRSGVLDVLAWLTFRVRECFAYEETLRATVDANGKLAIHVFRSDSGAISSGFLFDWTDRTIHAMALWHRDDRMDDADFVTAALREAASLLR